MWARYFVRTLYVLLFTIDILFANFQLLFLQLIALYVASLCSQYLLKRAVKENRSPTVAYLLAYLIGIWGIVIYVVFLGKEVKQGD